MAHGISLTMRYAKGPSVAFIHRHPAAVKIGASSHLAHGLAGRVFYRKPAGMTAFVGASRDRSLPGKARRRARKAANR